MIMETLTEVPTPAEDPDVLVLPDADEFVACTSCGNRSWMHFYYKGDLMSFCKHHGEKSETGLVAVGGSLVLDTRDKILD